MDLQPAGACLNTKKFLSILTTISKFWYSERVFQHRVMSVVKIMSKEHPSVWTFSSLNHFKKLWSGSPYAFSSSYPRRKVIFFFVLLLAWTMQWWKECMDPTGKQLHQLLASFSKIIEKVQHRMSSEAPCIMAWQLATWSDGFIVTLYLFSRSWNLNLNSYCRIALESGSWFSNLEFNSSRPFFIVMKSIWFCHHFDDA